MVAVRNPILSGRTVLMLLTAMLLILASLNLGNATGASAAPPRAVQIGQDCSKGHTEVASRHWLYGTTYRLYRLYYDGALDCRYNEYTHRGNSKYSTFIRAHQIKKSPTGMQMLLEKER